TVANNFQVQLAHARNDELAGFFVGETTERWIFLSQTLEAFTHLFAIGFGLRLDGHRDNWLGERRWLEQDFEIFVAERITSGDVLEPDERGDIARVSGLDVDPFVGLDHHDAAHAFALARARIINRITLLELAAVNAEEDELADVRIGPKLECQRTELAVIIGLDG